MSDSLSVPPAWDSSSRICHTFIQGYKDWSCWSRGQAWALAGFTMMYRETLLPEFLVTASKAADYFIANLPGDSVPPWDFQVTHY